MTRPLRIQYPGAFYYISQYSNSGIALFRSDEDRKHFLVILDTSRNIYTVTLHGFVLLNNHYHLLAETPHGNLSEFMRHMNISYTSYFNRKYNRKGHLYGGRYKSVLLEEQLFLEPVSRYLHLNPIKTGAMKRKKKEAKTAFLSTWKWSSLPGYLGMYPRYGFIDHHAVLKNFGGDTPSGRQQYGDSLQEQLETGYSLKSEVVGQVLLGSLPFIEKMKNRLARKGSDREQPELKKIEHFVIQEKILQELEHSLHSSREQLLHAPGDLRGITMDMLYRYGGLTNPEIGCLMDLDYSSISLGRKKIHQKRATNFKLDAAMTLLETRLQRLHAKGIEESS